MKNPIVEEVRKHRMEHTRKFKGNLAAICDDLRPIQDASGHEVWFAYTRDARKQLSHPAERRRPGGKLDKL